MTERSSGFVVAVVDDDQSVLRSIEYLLESAGDYSTRLFTSAIALLDSGLSDIDCLISDIDMLGTAGFELLRLVGEARPSLPIVLITGFPETLNRLSPLNGTKHRFFTKPFHGPELLAAVTDALRNVRSEMRFRSRVRMTFSRASAARYKAYHPN